MSRGKRVGIVALGTAAYLGLMALVVVVGWPSFVVVLADLGSGSQGWGALALFLAVPLGLTALWAVSVRAAWPPPTGECPRDERDVVR